MANRYDAMDNKQLADQLQSFRDEPGRQLVDAVTMRLRLKNSKVGEASPKPMTRAVLNDLMDAARHDYGELVRLINEHFNALVSA